ncbi:hypothetical protein N7481_008845 [Penicillium waksmanii]|uniref:uncharacterized protein n=1 Tax=Penicillium waksmanii TaxID=69791 RepID=UPI00254861FC|nr:uncharacterized protein N7481_008845 [Penicillium waksmanii]KAJ5975138.1 hypothetical protein N7481_008845 [Penicillium waksmanii]
MTNPYNYPPIPADFVDSFKPGPPPPRELNLVTRTHSDKWGPREIDSASALRETHVHLGNERLLRTHHRSLAACPFVYQATEADGNQIWVVSIGPSVPVYDTHAAGRAIHVQPEVLLPEPSHTFSGTRKDPLHRSINPRHVGAGVAAPVLPCGDWARMLISGFLIVLFRNQKDIEASWQEGCVHSFGLLRLGYDVAVHYPTEAVAESGNAVVDAQDGSATPLGLKLKFLDD